MICMDREHWPGLRSALGRGRLEGSREMHLRWGPGLPDGGPPFA